MKEIVNDGFAKVVKPYMDAQDKKSREIIAPVEVSPAEAAHSAGDQIIFNGILYDVTAPIAAGDALSTSGAGANISAADNIEAQIKATKSQIQTAAAQAAAQNKNTQEMIAPVEEDETDASRAYAIGDQLILDGVLYNVIDAIAQHGIITSEGAGANIEEADNVTDQLSSLNQTLTNAFVNNVNVNGSKNKLYLDLERLISDNAGGTWANNKYTYRGGEFTVNEDSITFGGTPTNVASIYFMLTNVEIPPEKYVLSGLVNCTNIMWGGVQLLKDDVSVQTFSINSKDNTEIDCSSYTYDTVRVEIKRNANNVAMSGTANVMLCLKSDWDLDNTFAPYSKSNLQLTQDSVTWDNLSEVGAVNLLNNQKTTQTINGVTFTVNSDKSITINGTATADSSLEIITATELGNICAEHTVKVNGAPSSASQSTCFIFTRDSSNTYFFDYGNGFVLSKGKTFTEGLKVRILSGQTYSNVVFKPMISLISYNGPYVPYAKSNKELTEDVTPISNVLTRGTNVDSGGANFCQKVGKVAVFGFGGHTTAELAKNSVLATLPFAPTDGLQVIAFNPSTGTAFNINIDTNGNLKNTNHIIANDNYFIVNGTYVTS